MLLCLCNFSTARVHHISRLHYATPRAIDLCTRNQWTAQQFDKINWKALQHAIKRKSKQRIHLTKLIHDILPTNTRVHCHSPNAQRCPSCQVCPQEDRDHIMRCSSTPQASWRAETIVSLETRCKQLQTDPGLAKVLVQGISQWLHGTDQMNYLTFQPKYRGVITQQNDIGWRQLFNGRMGNEWARVQDDYAYVQKMRKPENPSTVKQSSTTHQQTTRIRTGTQWSSEIIITLWEQWHHVWEMRNAVIHGHNQASRAKQQQAKDIHRLQSIYGTRHLMEPSVQDLLFPTVEDHQQQRNTSAIHNWLAIHEITFINSVKQASKRALRGVRSIKTYFSVLTPSLSHTGDTPAQPDPQNLTSQIGTNSRRPQTTILSYFATGRPPDSITTRSQSKSAVQSLTEGSDPPPV